MDDSPVSVVSKHKFAILHPKICAMEKKLLRLEGSNYKICYSISLIQWFLSLLKGVYEIRFSSVFLNVTQFIATGTYFNSLQYILIMHNKLHNIHETSYMLILYVWLGSLDLENGNRYVEFLTSTSTFLPWAWGRIQNSGIWCTGVLHFLHYVVLIFLDNIVYMLRSYFNSSIIQ